MSFNVFHFCVRKIVFFNVLNVQNNYDRYKLQLNKLQQLKMELTL